MVVYWRYTDQICSVASGTSDGCESRSRTERYCLANAWASKNGSRPKIRRWQRILDRPSFTAFYMQIRSLRCGFRSAKSTSTIFLWVLGSSTFAKNQPNRQLIKIISNGDYTPSYYNGVTTLVYKVFISNLMDRA